MAGSTIRSLNMLAKMDTAHFESGSRKVQASLKDIRSASTQTQSGFAAMGASMLKAGAGVAAAAVSFSALKAGISQIIAEGERMKSVQAAFTALAGSAEAGRKEFAFVADAANKLGVGVGALSETYKNLLASTRGTSLEGQKTKDIFEAVTAASRSLGLGTEQTAGALRALSQIASTGTVQMDELRNELGNHLPGALSIAARAMGVSTGELRKMVESGQLASEVFLPRFAAQLRSELGQSAEQATTTASQGFAKLGNAMSAMVSGPGQTLSTWIGGIVGGLADVVLKGEEARRKIDAIAQTRAQQDILTQTQGLGAAPTAANQAAQARLEFLTREIALREKNLALQKAELGVTTNVFRRGQLEQSINANARTLERLQQEYAQTLARIKATEGRGAPGVDVPIETGGALQRHTEEMAARAKAFQEAIAKTAAEAKTIRESPLTPLLTDMERAKQEFKVIEDGLEKLRKEHAGVEVVGPAADQLNNLFARQQALQQFMETGKHAAEEEKRLQRELKEEQKDYIQTVAQVAEANRTKIASVIDGLTSERDALSMTSHELDLYRLRLAGADEGALRLARSIQDDIDRLKDFQAQITETADAEAEIFSGRGLAEWEESQGKLAAAKRAEIDKVGDLVERQLVSQRRRQEELGRTTIDLVDGMVTALQKGGDAWEQFGRRVADVFLKMALEQSGLEQKLGKIVEGAVKLVAGLFGSSPTVDVSGGEAALFSATLAQPRAEGGPVMAGRPYLVGERGKPEIFIPSTSGQIVSNNDWSHAYTRGGDTLARSYENSSSVYGGSSSSHVAQQAVQVVNHFHIQTPDAASFQRSRSELGRAIALSVEGSMRHR